MKHILYILLILAISSCTYESFIPQLIQTTIPTKITAYSACIDWQYATIYGNTVIFKTLEK